MRACGSAEAAWATASPAAAGYCSVNQAAGRATVAQSRATRARAVAAAASAFARERPACVATRTGLASSRADGQSMIVAKANQPMFRVALQNGLEGKKAAHCQADSKAAVQICPQSHQWKEEEVRRFAAFDGANQAAEPENQKRKG